MGTQDTAHLPEHRLLRLGGEVVQHQGADDAVDACVRERDRGCAGLEQLQLHCRRTGLLGRAPQDARVAVEPDQPRTRRAANGRRAERAKLPLPPGPNQGESLCGGCDFGRR
jgi:hypothetical protein